MIEETPSLDEEMGGRPEKIVPIMTNEDHMPRTNEDKKKGKKGHITLAARETRCERHGH